jgi:hypothetical protein
MKSIRFAAVGAVLLFVGCGLGSLGGGGLPGVGTMSMKVDGTDWNAQSGTVVATSTAGLNSMTISGSNNTPGLPVNTVTIALEVEPKPGTYTFEGKKTAAFASGGAQYKAKSGSVVITKWDTQAEGTFDCVAQVTDGGTAQITITQGKFSASKN